MLMNWYNSVLSDMSPNKKVLVEGNDDNDNDVIECYCTKTPPNSILVFCAMCGKGQHAKCVNFAPKPLQEVPYLCAHCWTINHKYKCKATLIVVPQSILYQWTEEVLFFISIIFFFILIL